MPPRATQFTQVLLQNGNRAEPVEIWKARHFIHEHSDEGLSLTKVAKSVHISPNHLSDKFKEVTGINFVDYIARTRVEQAREHFRGRLSIVVAVQSRFQKAHTAIAEPISDAS